MTIEEQLRAIGRHADRHQPVITAAEIIQRASGQQSARTSPYDATASRRRLTIAPSTDGANFEPMEEMHMSENSADSEHATRWHTPAIAAAAIVVLGVGAIAFAVSNTNADDEGVSQAPASAAAPTTTPAPTTTNASRTVTEPITGTDLTVTYTPPDGWETYPAQVNFWNVTNVYADGCEHTRLDPPLGPTVDDLANVWATLPGFTATTPVAITVDGYTGKRVDYTVPNYPTVAGASDDGGRNADCAGGTFALWDEEGHSPSFWAQTPGQQNRQWIIDVNGTRLVINEWSEPGTTPEQLAGMDQFLASIQIG